MDIPGTENSDADGFEEENEPAAHGNQPRVENQQKQGVGVEYMSAMDTYKYFSDRLNSNVESVLDTAQEWLYSSITQQCLMMEALKELDPRKAKEDDFKLKLAEKQLIISNLDAKPDLKETDLYNTLVALRKMQQIKDNIMKSFFTETKNGSPLVNGAKLLVFEDFESIPWLKRLREKDRRLDDKDKQ